MTGPVVAATQLWWHVARAAGLVAWALAAASVAWGLALSTRALGSRPRAPWLLDLHRFLGGLTVVFVGVHLLGLWADTYVEFGVTDLFVPFASSWRPGAVAWGIVAFYLLVAVEVTSLVMKRLPKRLWHGIHLTSYLVYLFGTIHLLQAGSDASGLAVRLAVAATMAGIGFFLIYRVIGPGRLESARSAGSRAKVADTPPEITSMRQNGLRVRERDRPVRWDPAGQGGSGPRR